jgi:hypothetical protein
MIVVSSARRCSQALLGRVTVNCRRRMFGIRMDDRPTHPYLWAGFVTAGDWR